MNDINFNASFSNINLAAACGLYCGSCGIYLATQENDVEKLLQYAIVLNQSFDETSCNGCRAAKKSTHCSKMCSFIDCTHRKDIEFCGRCNEYPCQKLIEFQSEMPHRVDILESQYRLKEIGWKKWLIEQEENFTCSNCNAINSAYHLSCRACGNIPSNRFVARHKDLIEKHLSEE